MSNITKKNLKLRLDALNDENASQYEFMMRVKRALNSIDINVMDSDFDRKPELKGSDLCRAMKNKRDWVLAYVSDVDDATAERNKLVAIVTGVTPDGHFKRGGISIWRFAVPISSNGKILSAKNVGL